MSTDAGAPGAPEDFYAISGRACAWPRRTKQGPVRMITPDVATLLYRVTYTSTFKGGAPETSKVISSSLYVRRDNKWWSVLYQETPIK